MRLFVPFIAFYKQDWIRSFGFSLVTLWLMPRVAFSNWRLPE
jgi:hypothetical protein